MEGKSFRLLRCDALGEFYRWYEMAGALDRRVGSADIKRNRFQTERTLAGGRCFADEAAIFPMWQEDRRCAHDSLQAVYPATENLEHSQYLLLKDRRFFFLRPESAGLTFILRPSMNFPFKALMA